MAYPRKHGWEHGTRDTSRNKERVLGGNRNGKDAGSWWCIGLLAKLARLYEIGRDTTQGSEEGSVR